MKQEQIIQLFTAFEDTREEQQGVEYWGAPELQGLLGFEEQRDFYRALRNAKRAVHDSGHDVSDHFVESDEQNPRLTRYACHLIAQNSNTSDEQAAFARTYFLMQTHKQEEIVERLLEQARINERDKLIVNEKKLSGALKERGVSNEGFSKIRSMGDEALFGGRPTNDVKYHFGVPAGRPLADFLPTSLISAKNTAAEMTRYNIGERRDLVGQDRIASQHVINNQDIRIAMRREGLTPELLPPAPDIKKIRRKVISMVKREQKALEKKTH